jgi:radical SAM-linked protein
MRFASHRDIARAVERGVRKAGLPIAYSAGFTPHPKISYAGAAATGVASEAEYLELTFTSPCRPEDVRARLDAALPDGIDVVDVTERDTEPPFARLEASHWQVTLPGVPRAAAEAAMAEFLAASRVEVERLTKKGPRRMDARAAVVSMQLDRRADEAGPGECEILRMVVRHVTPAVRPDDILAALSSVAAQKDAAEHTAAGLVPTAPPVITRLAQCSLDAGSLDVGSLETGSLETGPFEAGCEA